MSDLVFPIDYWPKIVYEQTIKDYMRQYIQGQEQTVELLAYIGYLYTLQLSGLKHGIRKKSMPKVNCLLTAPTGCGKTFMVSKFAEALGLSYYKIDCSSVRAEGWHGPNLSEYLYKFLKVSPNGTGVLHLDEMDKMMIIEGGHNIDGKMDVQTGLLDLLDGNYTGLYENRNNREASPLDKVNNCLVILSGSFQSVRNYDKRKEEQEKEEELLPVSRPIGFSADFNSIENKEEKKEEKVLSWKERMKELGFIHELASRIVCQAELEPYTTEQIKDILLQGKESAYNKYLNLTGHWNKLEDEEIDEVITEMQESENGLRDMESLLFKRFFEKRTRR